MAQRTPAHPECLKIGVRLPGSVCVAVLSGDIGETLVHSICAWDEISTCISQQYIMHTLSIIHISNQSEPRKPSFGQILISHMKLSRGHWKLL